MDRDILAADVAAGLTSREIAAKHGLKVGTIKVYRARWGIKSGQGCSHLEPDCPHRWTEADKAKLSELLGTLSYEEIGKSLGRPAAQVKDYCGRNGLKGRRLTADAEREKRLLQEREELHVAWRPTWVDQSQPCKPWTKGCDKDGYGVTSSGGRAHRNAWILAYGQPPKETPNVLHHCDNPPCYELTHLFLGTTGDNNRDRVAKGRDHNLAKTHCKKKHLLDGVNKQGRYCKTCHREREQLRRTS